MHRQALLRRYRLVLGLFMVGLIISGLTAFPLLTEVQLLARGMEIDAPDRYPEYAGLKHWIAYVLSGLEHTYFRYPFVAYGTDWLAFGHLAIAIFFIRPWMEPEESDWVLRCGLVCCVGVIPFALIAGALRGIPLYWRLIDCSFGVFGAVPLLCCLRISHRLRQQDEESYSAAAR